MEQLKLSGRIFSAAFVILQRGKYFEVRKILSFDANCFDYYRIERLRREANIFILFALPVSRLSGDMTASSGKGVAGKKTLGSMRRTRGV